MARGAVLCTPTGPQAESDLRVIAATGEAPAGGTVLSPASLTGTDRRLPLLSADPAADLAGHALILIAPGETTPNAAAALEAIQAAVALTLYNAQTVEQSQQAVSESAALREVATEMVTQNELASLLDFIVNTARALLGADYCGLAESGACFSTMESHDLLLGLAWPVPEKPLARYFARSMPRTGEVARWRPAGIR